MNTLARTDRWILWIVVLGSGIVIAATWLITTSPSLSSLVGLNPPATPTPAPFHGYMEITKPTYTPIPSATPLPSPTAIPIPPTVEYVSPGVDNTTEESAVPEYLGNKYILIDISDQYMYAYEGDILVFDFLASTGMNNATSTGSFKVLNKIPSAYGSTWNIWMPNWLGIYWSAGLENGIHGLPVLPNGSLLWEGFLGTPISYGCVVIGTHESEMLYDWAEVGTPVDIQW